MIYIEKIPVDANGHLVECPVCGNTEFSSASRYCRICGMSRSNMCVPDDNSHPHENPVNARFCEYCGARTTFFLQKILLPWIEVSRESKKEAPPPTEDELPF